MQKCEILIYDVFSYYKLSVCVFNKYHFTDVKKMRRQTLEAERRNKQKVTAGVQIFEDALHLPV